MTRARVTLLPALLLLLGHIPLGAQEVGGGTEPHPGEALEVSLITIGQGDLVWERFGHNAILIENRETGWGAAYNWGIFSFGQVDFIPRLIRGTMLYSMGGYDPDSSVAQYRREGRPVWLQKLALTPAQRWDLLISVEENALPENRDYRYDYYQDNCSTRVRDALDQVLGGRLESLFSTDTTNASYRWHTRRILREMPLYYLGIQFVLGPSGDRPITVWEEMFLPPTLMDRIRDVRVPDGQGGTMPLVTAERALFDPGRPEPPTSPPFALPIFLAAGFLFAGAFLRLVGSGSGLGAGKRTGVALLAGGWGLMAGVGGILLLGAWAFTDHTFWYANFNLFQVSPFSLLLLPAFIIFLARKSFPRWGLYLAVVLGLASLLGAALEALPGVGQRNAEILALTLPVNLAIWAGAVRLRRAGKGRSQSVDGPDE